MVRQSILMSSVLHASAIIHNAVINRPCTKTRVLHLLYDVH